MHLVGCFIIIGIQPLGWFGQRPGLSQATGMALVRCILGKFLGVVCHCFPPRLDVPTFATRCLHVLYETKILIEITLCVTYQHIVLCALSYCVYCTLLCVLYHCHRVLTQLQSTNISISISI